MNKKLPALRNIVQSSIPPVQVKSSDPHANVVASEQQDQSAGSSENRTQCKALSKSSCVQHFGFLETEWLNRFQMIVKKI